jgi:hypothetical protein
MATHCRWDLLHTPLPADADIAWLGSYRRYTARLTMDRLTIAIAPQQTDRHPLQPHAFSLQPHAPTPACSPTLAPRAYLPATPCAHRSACNPMCLSACSRTRPCSMQARSLWNHPWANGTRGEWRARRRWRWPSPDGGGVRTRTTAALSLTSDRQLREGGGEKGPPGRRSMRRHGLPPHEAPDEHGPDRHGLGEHGPGEHEPEYARGVPIVGSVARTILTLALAQPLTLTLTRNPIPEP